jgi:rare lipoprotein A (peptidoglycan hydrolase)
MINKNIRLTAMLTLAFLLMMFVSMVSTAIKHTNKKTSYTKKIEVEKHIENKKISKNKKDTKKTLNLKKVKTKVSEIPENIVIKKDTSNLVDVTHHDLTHHKATWYRTEGTRVHKEHDSIHGTAAYNFLPKGTKLLVTNIANNKSCIVEITDRMGFKGRNHIDLSHKGFGAIANHSSGTEKVIIKILERW